MFDLNRPANREREHHEPAINSQPWLNRASDISVIFTALHSCKNIFSSCEDFDVPHAQS